MLSPSSCHLECHSNASRVKPGRTRMAEGFSCTAEDARAFQREVEGGWAGRVGGLTETNGRAERRSQDAAAAHQPFLITERRSGGGNGSR
ncbi:hypothetical protein PBY51_005611 [Eleginops maclovinus]|uniref:Uncharacterized protein n=1 Tax=Eleginops maclovinus TaxID=56733 RepID=A0AAN7X8P3_ELEMC|nr:hypothetical protein PBY51_005611 [Eleginops maclovinus]